MTDQVDRAPDQLALLLAYLDQLAALERQIRDRNRRLVKGNPQEVLYAGVTQFVLQHGGWAPQGPSDLEGVARGPLRECYANAAQVAIHWPDRFVYCEGIALPEGLIPVNHAWCYDLEAKAFYDPTWRDVAEYVGVPFQLDYLTKVTWERNAHGALIDAWLEDWPLLTGRQSLNEALNMPLAEDLWRALSERSQRARALD